MRPYNFKTRELVRCFTIAGLQVAVTSDNHVRVDQLPAFADELVNQIRPHNPDLIVLAGDHGENAKGKAIQRPVGGVVRHVGEAYPDTAVAFSPGNHCLRGNGVLPWYNFGYLPPNVMAPVGFNDPVKPVRFAVKGVQVVVANVFYDKFVDLKKLGSTEAAARAFYHEQTIDGQKLLKGRREIFRTMADNAAEEIRKHHTDIFISHGLPDRALCEYRIPAKTLIHERLEEEGYRFLVDPKGDARIAKRMNKTPEQMRSWWTLKGAVAMGSDILTRHGMPVPPGLNIIHGHSHRSRSGEEIVVRGQPVKVFSYQPNLSY